MTNKTCPKILMVGTGSLLNYGCEAIVQGTYALTREYWPESHLFVASDDIEYDSKLFADCEKISFVPYRKRFTPYRLLMGILRRIGIGEGSPVRMDCSIIDNYDIYLASGGDNYGQAPDGSLYHLLLDLMTIGERAHKQKKYYALWGASVGPFSEENLVKVKANLMKTDAIFTREEIYFHYLRSIGLAEDKIHLVADPAFWMEPEYAPLPIEKKPDELIIGLNISPLSIHVTFDNYEQGKRIIFESLDTLLENNPKYRFLCVPHVMSDTGGSQDDFTFMRLYRDFTRYKSRVDVVDFGLGARKTKSIVSQCDLLIAARMHCCVAGLSSATPTILLTYSQKGLGMADYVYGNRYFALPMNEINEQSLYKIIISIESKLDFYKKYLVAHQERFKDDAAKAIITLKNLY